MYQPIWLSSLITHIFTCLYVINVYNVHCKKRKKTFANKIHLHNSNSSDHQ
jgi:hypothetical protein